MLDQTPQVRALLSRVADMTAPPLVMGILNVTPDSFHDGGRFASPEAAVAHGLSLASEGADLIDVGGESTRPGATSLTAAEEASRVVPVIRALARATTVPLSVDTRHALVAEAAIEAGAVMVNDVSAFTADSDMIPLLVRARPLAVAMHMRGDPSTMQTRTDYRAFLADCIAELWASVTAACNAGFPHEHVFVDPGIGFAKTPAQCLEILRHLDLFVALGRPVLIGPSRKSFVGAVLDRPTTGDRLFGTAAAVALATASGARVIRVHDVSAMCDVVRVAHAVTRASSRENAA